MITSKILGVGLLTLWMTEQKEILGDQEIQKKHHLGLTHKDLKFVLEQLEDSQHNRPTVVLVSSPGQELQDNPIPVILKS